jgi:hypothetical protein
MNKEDHSKLLQLIIGFQQHANTALSIKDDSQAVHRETAKAVNELGECLQRIVDLLDRHITS